MVSPIFAPTLEPKLSPERVLRAQLFARCGGRGGRWFVELTLSLSTEKRGPALPGGGLERQGVEGARNMAITSHLWCRVSYRNLNLNFTVISRRTTF